VDKQSNRQQMGNTNSSKDESDIYRRRMLHFGYGMTGCHITLPNALDVKCCCYCDCRCKDIGKYLALPEREVESIITVEGKEYLKIVKYCRHFESCSDRNKTCKLENIRIYHN